MDDKATLVNLRYIDGELKQVFIDSKGNEIIKDIEGVSKCCAKSSTTEFDARFSKTDSVPVQDIGPKTSPLIKKVIAKEFTTAMHDMDGMTKLMQHNMDMTIQFHAMLIEIFGAPENFDDERAKKVKESLNKETRFKAYVNKHLLLMGDVWADVYRKINP
jgi:hypothetical protein